MKTNLFKGKKANAVIDFILNILVPMIILSALFDGWSNYTITTRIALIVIFLVYTFLIPFAHVSLRIAMRRKRLKKSQ